jgi:hypothetical protein
VERVKYNLFICADLNERDLERWQLAVHKDAGQIQLHLETDVHVGAVDSWTPPTARATA